MVNVSRNPLTSNLWHDRLISYLLLEFKKKLIEVTISPVCRSKTSEDHHRSPGILENKPESGLKGLPELTCGVRVTNAGHICFIITTHGEPIHIKVGEPKLIPNDFYQMGPYDITGTATNHSLH
jgi:hypothetical protein